MPTEIKKGQRRGEPYRFVITRTKGKTITRGYKDHGGPDNLYLRLSRVPKGTKILIDYPRNRIIRSPRLIDRQVTQVRDRRKTIRKQRTTRKKKIPLPALPVVRRIKAPTPPKSTRLLAGMPRHVFYEQEHSLNDFITPERERAFLRNILSKATRSKKQATHLLKTWTPDVRLKFSYVVRVRGVNSRNNQVDCASFTLVGSKPRDIIDILNKTGLKPGEQLTLRETPGLTGTQLTPGDIQKSHHRIGQVTMQSGTYRIFDVRVSVKFYNNPQRTL